MFNAYDPVQVAWKIVDTARRMGIYLTHMQLQKLVYIAHGFSLAGLHRPLIAEPVTAWKYGPVIPRVYQAFKEYGGSVIPQPINTPYFSHDVEQLIQSVVNSYGRLSGVQLSELTHQVGTPWYNVWVHESGHLTDNAVIPDHAIKSHYEKLLCGQCSHSL